jgi:hypothetical protein
VRWPKAATQHHSEAASSSQLSEAHSSAQAITRRSRASRENEWAASRTACSSFSPLRNGILSPTVRIIREANFAPRMTPYTSSPTASSTMVPMTATVP